MSRVVALTFCVRHRSTVDEVAGRALVGEGDRVRHRPESKAQIDSNKVVSWLRGLLLLGNLFCWCTILTK